MSAQPIPTSTHPKGLLFPATCMVIGAAYAYKVYRDRYSVTRSFSDVIKGVKPITDEDPLFPLADIYHRPSAIPFPYDRLKATTALPQSEVDVLTADRVLKKLEGMSLVPVRPSGMVDIVYQGLTGDAIADSWTDRYSSKSHLKTKSGVRVIKEKVMDEDEQELGKYGRDKGNHDYANMLIEEKRKQLIASVKPAPVHEMRNH